MSSRQLRKLQKQRELEKEKELDNGEGIHEDESSEDEVPAQTAKPRASLFAALGGDEEDGGDDDHDDDDDDDDGGGIDKEESRENTTYQTTQPATVNSSSQSKKQRKRKKKKKAKKSAGTEEPQTSGQEGEDEIDKAIKALKVSTRLSEEPSSDAASRENVSHTAKLNALLSIDAHHLKAANEMRALFGRDVLSSAAAEEEAAGAANAANRRQNATQQVDLETFLREPPGAKKLPEVTLRRNIFIQGRDHWPRQPATGLIMKEVGKHAEWTEYAFCHAKEYDSMQAVFFAYVQVGDPMRMVFLLKEIPYHVSTLLQVSSVAKQDQNMALAAELCERALFTFGRVTTSAFRQDMEKGRARIEFRRPENRQFWLAGYHYLKSLIRKGTYRTALEWAKLLYSLDHEDSYAMRNFIHLLAIRAHESEWLMEFLAELERGDEHGDVVYLRQSLVLAQLQLGNTAGAREMLSQGIRTVPWLYCALFQELGLDAPPSIWGISPDNDAQQFWVKLYLYLAKDLWNNPQATGLLQDVAGSMIDKVDRSVLERHDMAPDLAAVRLAYLEGQTSLLSVAPREILERQPNYEFDPLPVPEEENIFTSGDGSRLPWQKGGLQAAQTLVERAERREMRRGGQEMAGAGMLGGRGAGAFADEGDGVEENWSDDEELRQDLEAAAARGGGNGILGPLLQLLGIGGRGNAQDGQDGQDGQGEQNEQDEQDRFATDDELPGAWPAEER